MADQKAKEVEYLELTVVPNFEEVFTQAMWFPHMKDRFPHLKHLLPGFKQSTERVEGGY